MSILPQHSHYLTRQFVAPPNLVASTSTPPVLNDPSLQSTWSHRNWVATGCATVLVSLGKAIVGAGHSHIWLEPMLAGYIGRQFANNLHALARAVAFFVLPVDLVCNDPIVNAFVGVCSGCIMFSQQFHAWAHGTKSKLPPIVVAMQDAGLLVSRSQHGAHHRQPYNNNYCIVSGFWNEFLDENKVFEALEMALYFKVGVRPRSWSEPTTDWTEETETASQVAGK
ncbi:fatty acid desaturase [Salix suchowensis]|nr:fatty acid desaturase [Salix suchowensis]